MITIIIIILLFPLIYEGFIHPEGFWSPRSCTKHLEFWQLEG